MKSEITELKLKILFHSGSIHNSVIEGKNIFRTNCTEKMPPKTIAKSM